MITPNSLLQRLDLAVLRHVTLADLADRLGRLHGDRVFVTEVIRPGVERSLTFAQMRSQTARWSAAIAARSRPRTPVVVATPNGVEQFLLCLAVSRAGGLPVPVNPQMTAFEVRHVIKDCGAELVIRSADELDSGPGSRSAITEPFPFDADDGAALFYTSGTTGSPKGAELTHRGLVGQAATAALWPTGLRRDELLLSLPVAHIMGFAALLAPAMAGFPVYFLPRFSAARALDLIEDRRVSAFMGVPAMYRMLLDAGAADRDLSSVRAWLSGADTMPPELARAFKSFGATVTLPGIGPIGEAAFVEGYGMVEVGGGVAAKMSPPLLPFGLGESLGLPFPGWRFRVAGPDGRPVATGQVGELWLKGPGVLKSYWGDVEATANALTEDGWLRTGDLVRAGVLGTVLFNGRSKHVIISGGYTVYPVEVEAALAEHPAVAEAAVVGLPDAKLGEVPAAAIRLVPGERVSVGDLSKWAAERLAHYKVPRRIVVVSEDFPRTATRKVRRDAVCAMFEEAAS